MHARMGRNCEVADGAIVGHRYTTEATEAVVGDSAIIRSRSIIYGDVTIGDGLVTGHGVLIRENTKIGDHALVGTNTVLDGHLDIGDDVSLETGVYIPPGSVLGDQVFVGPNAVFTNDRYPQRFPEEYEPRGPTLSDNVTIGANATLLPDIDIGEGAMIGAGAVVTEDVPAWHLAVGNPASLEPLPERLKIPNQKGGEE